MAFNLAAFELATSPGSRRRRSACPLLADCLFWAVELLGCLILAKAVELRPGGLVDRPPGGASIIGRGSRRRWGNPEGVPRPLGRNGG